MTAVLPLPSGLGGVGFLWGLTGIGFWILLVALIVLVLGRARTATRDAGAPAVRLLEERYARGEITREDFRKRRAVLATSSCVAGEGDGSR